MVSTLKKTAIAAAVAGALSASLPAQATTGIKFDPTGTGSAGQGFNVFNWVLNSILSQASFDIPDSGISGSTESIITSGAHLIGQGSLDTGSLGGGPSTSLAGFTYVFSVPVKVTTDVNNTTTGGAPKSVQVAWVDTTTPDYGATNYFRIYHSSGAQDPAAGTGFASGTLIFEGKIDVNPSTGYSNTDASIVVPIGNTGTLSQGPNAIYSSQGGGSMSLNVEQCSAKNVADGLPQCAATTYIDPLYFRSDVEGLTVDVNLGTQLTTPFASGDFVPAQVNNATPYYGDPVAGPRVLDNVTCEFGATPCDMLYDGQNAKSNWFGNFVPEPGSVALLGIGLAGLGGFSRRNRKKDSA